MLDFVQPASPGGGALAGDGRHGSIMPSPGAGALTEQNHGWLNRAVVVRESNRVPPGRHGATSSAFVSCRWPVLLRCAQRSHCNISQCLGNRLFSGRLTLVKGRTFDCRVAFFVSNRDGPLAVSIERIRVADVRRKSTSQRWVSRKRCSRFRSGWRACTIPSSAPADRKHLSPRALARFFVAVFIGVGVTTLTKNS
jgi:hypothetical protein